MKPKKWEIILVLGLVFLLGLWAFLPRSTGNDVTVFVNGTQTGTYPLHENLRLAIGGYNGFSLTLVIENGQAHVEASTCPDLICQHHAAISDSGEQIVCLPARVVIAVSGEEAEIDAVTG